MNNSASIPTVQTPHQFDQVAWHILAARAGKIHKVHAIWQRELVFQPTLFTAEERAEKLAEMAQSFSSHGMSTEESEKNAQQWMDGIEGGSVGFTTLDLVRVHHVRKATVSSDGYTLTEDTPYSIKARYIDFFDGSKAGRFNWTASYIYGQPYSQTQWKWEGDVYPPSSPKALSMLGNATLVSDRTPMDRSLPDGYDILLLQMPVAPLFTPPNADWTMQADHCVLTTRAQDKPTYRLTVSKATGCPLRLERLHRNSLKAALVHEVTQTQLVDGLEVPSEIIVYSPGSGSLENYREKYTLQSCHLNDDVPDSEMDLPSGTSVRDFRLGDDKQVDYNLPDGRMLPDSEVEYLYHTQQQKSHWSRAALIGLPVLGLGALGTLGTLSLKKKGDECARR